MWNDLKTRIIAAQKTSHKNELHENLWLCIQSIEAFHFGRKENEDDELPGTTEA